MLADKGEDLGTNEVWLHRSIEAEARGWAAAMSGDFPVGKRKSGRGERGCPATNDLPVTMRLAEPPESGEWLRSA
jgi:hypothetical protein